jgi:hypothetical protein
MYWLHSSWFTEEFKNKYRLPETSYLSLGESLVPSSTELLATYTFNEEIIESNDVEKNAKLYSDNEGNYYIVLPDKYTNGRFLVTKNNSLDFLKLFIHDNGYKKIRVKQNWH